MRIVADSLKSYFENIKLVLPFSFLVLVVVLFTMSFFTYVTGGAGFLRYTDVISMSLSSYEIFLYFMATVIGTFSVSFLSVAIVLLVKLRRTLDDIGFMKMLYRFPRNVWKLMLIWFFLGAITFAIGVGTAYFNLPGTAMAFLMLLVWGFFIFVPQTLVLEEYGFIRSLKESAKFFLKKPGAVIGIYLISVIGLFVLVLIETMIGHLKVFWLSPIFSSFLLFVFVLPYIEFLKTNLYLSRYKLLTSGIK